MSLQETLINKSVTDTVGLIKQVVNSYTFIDYAIVEAVDDNMLTVKLAHKMNDTEIIVKNVEILSHGTKAFKVVYKLVKGDVVQLFSAQSFIETIAELSETGVRKIPPYSTPTLKAVPLSLTEGTNTLTLNDDGSYMLEGEAYTLTVDSNGIKLECTKDVTIDTDKKLIVDAEAVNLCGNSKSLVTYAELNTALITFLKALTLTLASGANGGGPVVFAVAPPTSIDISAAEANKVKTG